MRHVAGAPALVVIGILALTSPWYGFHGDELYFRTLPLAWWYDDQPPLTVWLAHAAASASDAVWVQRIPAMIAAGCGVFVAAAFPRLLGYPAPVQRTAAWAHGLTVFPLLVGHVFLTATFDLLVWQLVLLGVVAALTGRRPGLAWAGVAAGLGCWNKLLVLVLAAAVVVALVTCARRFLRTRDALVGALALVLLGGFQVGAQVRHGLPMLTVSRDLVANGVWLDRALVLVLMPIFLGPPFTPVWWRGLWTRFDEPLSGHRSGPVLAIVAAVTLAFCLASPGQPYYAVGAFLPALAIGWGAVAERGTDLWRRSRLVVGTNGCVATVLCLPIVPPTSPAFTVVAALDPAARDQVGWPEAARQMAVARRSNDTAVVTDSYALAGAAVRYGPAWGLPRRLVASGHNALGSLGPPPVTAQVLLVGHYAPAQLRHLRACRPAGAVRLAPHDPFGLDGTPMTSCSLPPDGWNTAWPVLQRLGG